MRERIDPATLSDFVVYADESGDHGLQHVDPNYPVFVLAFVVMSRSDYLQKVTPALQQLKFNYWGHDQVVFHEREIRKKEGAFAILANPETQEAFMNELTTTIADLPFQLCLGLIDKGEMERQGNNRSNPYSVALHSCMLWLLATLRKDNQGGKLVHVIFESRGRNEDTQLELEFRRIADNQSLLFAGLSRDFKFARFEPVFARKDANAAGLQLADLVARPCGLRVARPSQANRAFEILVPKLVGGLDSWIPFPLPKQQRGPSEPGTPKPTGIPPIQT